MKAKKFLGLGLAAMLTGSVLVGASIYSAGGISGPAFAGESTPTATFDPCLDFAAVQQPCVTPSVTVTSTPGKLRTHTPTSTNTSLPSTSTPIPPTNTPTKVPTQNSAGNLGASVKPPNTGTGSGTGGTGASLWLTAAGVLLSVLGGGSVLYGIRRRG